MVTPKITHAVYKSIKVSDLLNRRRGRHHDLTEGIVRELKALKEGLALVIPLANVGGVEVTNLRSAVHRAAAAVNLAIETQSDETNLYLWINPVPNPANSVERPST